MTTILVGTDTSAAADLAVEDAARMARERGAELLVLYVRPNGADRAVVDPIGRPIRSRTSSGSPQRFPGVATTTLIEGATPRR